MELSAMYEAHSGIFNLATILKIIKIDLTAVSAIATIAEELFPFDRNNRWTFLSDPSDHMGTYLNKSSKATISW